MNILIFYYYYFPAHAYGKKSYYTGNKNNRNAENKDKIIIYEIIPVVFKRKRIGFAVIALASIFHCRLIIAFI